MKAKPIANLDQLGITRKDITVGPKVITFEMNTKFDTMLQPKKQPVVKHQKKAERLPREQALELIFRIVFFQRQGKLTLLKAFLKNSQDGTSNNCNAKPISQR